MAKVMCGLWHCHVDVSEHNNNGKCECIDCFGTHCGWCNKYLALSMNTSDVSEKFVCNLCRKYQAKTR